MSVQDHEGEASSGQVIPDREACLAAAYDHGLEALWLASTMCPPSLLHADTPLAAQPLPLLMGAERDGRRRSRLLLGDPRLDEDAIGGRQEGKTGIPPRRIAP